MTSNDIYYRLGRIEGNIESLQADVKDLKAGQKQLERELKEFRKEHKEDINGLHTLFNDGINGLRTETKTEINGLRTEFKAEIESLRGEIQSLRSEIISNIGIWFSLFAAVITFVSITVPLLIHYFTHKEKKTKHAPEAKPEQESEHSFNLVTEAIKGLIDYYKTGK